MFKNLRRWSLREGSGDQDRVQRPLASRLLGSWSMNCGVRWITNIAMVGPKIHVMLYFSLGSSTVIASMMEKAWECVSLAWHGLVRWHKVGPSWATLGGVDQPHQVAPASVLDFRCFFVFFPHEQSSPSTSGTISIGTKIPLWC